MDPVAFHLGPLTIRWYGVFAACGFIVAFLFLMRRARGSRIFKQEQAADLAFFGIIGAIAGSRILYVVENWGHFRDNLLLILRIDEGGLVFYGGLAGATAAVVLTSRLKHQRITDVADLFAPVIPLGHAFGRIGCFLNGCCFGKPWDSVISVQYPVEHYPHIASIQVEQGIMTPIVPVIPVQLIASIGNVIIFSILLVLEKRGRRCSGELFLAYMVFYSVLRFMTEFLRGDYLHRSWGLTSAQWWCIVGMIAGTALMFVLHHRRRPQDSADVAE